VAGNSWTDTGYVFTNNVGGPLDDSKLRKRYRKFLAASGIRYIRIHDIRHTFATIVIEDDSGQLASVSKALGHSTIGITMDIYAKTARIETHATSRMSEIMFPDRGKVEPISVAPPGKASSMAPGHRRAS
jgi:integrase